MISDMAFNEQIHRQQKEHMEKIEEWKDKYNLQNIDGHWYKNTALVITLKLLEWQKETTGGPPCGNT
jgi:hypothetical protein